MENFVIPRRFVRIKALQNLYAYTITEQAHKQEVIEQVKKDFIFDKFFNEPAEKQHLANAQSLAVALCYEAITKQLPSELIAYQENKKIEQSVRKHLGHYMATLRQDQTFLQNGFNQAKESIYIDLLYTLLLLLAWYKLAKAEHDSCKPGNLKKQLSQDPLLEELYNHNKWIKAIYKNEISWAKHQDKVLNWYSAFIQSAEMPQTYVSDANSSVNFLDCIVQDIILKESPINDFLAMRDLYWDEHKRIVKKILTQIFRMLSTKDFAGFTLFWQNLERNWTIEAAFYNRLCTIVIQNNSVYEAMIGQKSEKWDSERILLTDKLILKLALAELLECKEIPCKVSINEYIEIAKWYGTTKSGAFVNGVLEGILKGINR
ncbi:MULTISPECIES: transcription antitermination factor NusB [unclassified Candidatus Cardinium]|uniref:transcription antitermination factor NusB n=1 Tax=unclassified Candidatus Cardinium TaxID=2641185 RepID=UPI001FB55AF9|nr:MULTISPECIES: transcription antitermination factor NusB [unclassified Candidatus Cardinium]